MLDVLVTRKIDIPFLANKKKIKLYSSQKSFQFDAAKYLWIEFNLIFVFSTIMLSEEPYYLSFARKRIGIPLKCHDETALLYFF